VEDVTTKRTVGYSDIEELILPYLKQIPTMEDERHPIRFKLNDEDEETESYDLDSDELDNNPVLSTAK
jgi:hypothetical protein